MAMRMSGLISGLDTDSLISQLVSAKRLKVKKTKGDQTKLSWKQEKWKDLNKQLVSLRTTASNLRWSSSWNKKTTSVSDSTKASVITGSSAVDSVQSLKITQLAKAGYMTGGVVKAVDGEGNETGNKVTALSKMSDLGITGDAKFDLTIGGKKTEITVGANSSISDVLSSLKKQGLNASFDEKNQRFFISSKTTGAKADFSITAADATSQNALNKLGLSSYDKPAIEQLKSYRTYTDDEVNAEMQKRAQAGADAYKELFNSHKAAEKNLADLIKQRDELDDPDRETEATDEERAALNDKIAEAQAKVDELQAKVSDAESSKIWSGDIEYERDENDNITGIASISNVAVSSEASSALEAEVRAEFDQRVEFANSQLAAIENGTLKGGATKVVGQDAKIELNGAEFESSNNVFDINGLTITALAETAENESVTLTTTNDTSGLYDQIKNFINTYNNIINELDKLYNAESSSKFTPLSDEEKEALSDTEVEKYETKIKDGLFKGDEAISDIMSSLTGGMAQGFKIGDKTYHLSDFGINTLSYFEAERNETHAFHIDGDEKDEKTSGKADKLKGLIASDPDSVSNFFTKLTNDIYQRLDKLSSRKPGRRTYGTFYEDQVMKEDNKNYDSKISELEEKANKYEDNLYAKFSKMEATMAKLQSKTSALTGLFGGGG